MLGRPVTEHPTRAGAGQARPIPGGASGPGRPGCHGRHSRGRRPAARSCDRHPAGAGGMIATTMDAIGVLQVVVGIAQLLVGAVAIGLVLRGRRGAPQEPDFPPGWAWAVAGWAVFGLLGLVWVADGVAGAASRRIALGVPQSAPSPGESGNGPWRSHWTSANRPLPATKPWARSWVSSVRCRLMFTTPPQAGPPARHPAGGGDGAAVVGRRVGGRAARARCRSAASRRLGGSPRWCRPAVGLGSADCWSLGDLVADRADPVTAALLAPRLASGRGELEPTGWARGDPAASQQMQRRLLVVGHGSAVLGSNHGRV